MPWWTYGYWILFVGMGILGILDDLKHSRNPFAPAVGGITVVAGSFFFFSYWKRGLLTFLGGYAVPLFVAAIMVEILWAYFDLVESRKQEENDTSSVVIGVAIAAAVSLPAYIFGAMAVFRE